MTSQTCDHDVLQFRK